MAKRKPITPVYPYDPLEDSAGGGQKTDSPAKPGSNPKSRQLMFVVMCLAAAAVVCVIIACITVVAYLSDVQNNRRLNSELRDTADTGDDENTGNNNASYTERSSYMNAFDLQMRGINPDYVCWLTIDGTAIDYPVVRGADNDKYVHTAFTGEENILGALFMDYRCAGDNVPHIIIYGHNSREGDMFGRLRNYLDAGFMEKHPVITLKVNGRTVEYEVFAARRTDTDDYVYFLDFSEPGSFYDFAELCGAPPDTHQILTLSTCVSGNDPEERVIVQAALK